MLLDLAQGQVLIRLNEALPVDWLLRGLQGLIAYSGGKRVVLLAGWHKVCDDVEIALGVGVQVERRVVRLALDIRNVCLLFDCLWDHFTVHFFDRGTD